MNKITCFLLAVVIAIAIGSTMLLSMAVNLKAYVIFVIALIAVIAATGLHFIVKCWDK